MAWIRTVPEGKAEGALVPIYDAAVHRAGRVFGIMRLMSIEPTTLDSSMGLYMATTTHPRSTLPRWFRELVALHVSRLNHCFY